MKNLANSQRLQERLLEDDRLLLLERTTLPNLYPTFTSNSTTTLPDISLVNYHLPSFSLTPSFPSTPDLSHFDNDTQPPNLSPIMPSHMTPSPPTTPSHMTPSPPSTHSHTTPSPPTTPHMTPSPPTTPSHMTPSPPSTHSHTTPSPPTTPHTTPSPPNMENIDNYEHCTLSPTSMENTDDIEYDYYTPSPPSMETI